MYNNLSALASNYNLGSKQQFFILPEFQKFQHTFKKLNPGLISRLTDSNLLEAARYLELNYRQCLHRLENPTAQAPYNFVITREWMFMVNRSRPTDGQIMINSLGFLGLLYGKTQEVVDEISERKPLGILMQVAVPVFEGRSNQQQYRNGGDSISQNGSLGSGRGASIKKRVTEKDAGSSGAAASSIQVQQLLSTPTSSK